MSEQINNIMNTTMGNLKNFIDINSVVGDPITTPDGTTIIPVIKVNVGFASGGSDFASSKPKDNFGGGGGGGISITPIAFLVVKDGNVRLLQTSKNVTSADKAVDMMPEMVDKVSSLFNKNKNADTSNGETL